MLYLNMHNIPSNKRNAPNIKVNQKFVVTMKVFMNINVMYEYVKMFESMTKLRDY